MGSPAECNPYFSLPQRCLNGIAAYNEIQKHDPVATNTVAKKVKSLFGKLKSPRTQDRITPNPLQMMTSPLQEKAALHIDKKALINSQSQEALYFIDLIKKKVGQEIKEIQYFDDLFKRDGLSSIFLRAFIKLKCESWLNCLINDKNVQDSLIKANNLTENSSPETAVEVLLDDFSTAYHLACSQFLPKMPPMLEDIYVFLLSECTKKFAKSRIDIESLVFFQFFDKIILLCYECSPKNSANQERIINHFITKINF